MSGLFLLTLLINATIGYGQGLGNSPYSILGLGDLHGTEFSMNEATGGAGVSSSNGLQLNGINPALIVRNRFTAFEFAGSVQYKDVKAPGAQAQDLAANLAYMALSFPITAKWSSGVSIKPYSYVDYNTSSSSMVAGTNYPSVYSFSGKGAINRVAWTNGFAIGKYVNVGMDIFYLFGNIHKSSEVSLVTGDADDNTVGVKEKLNVRNVSGRGGLAVRVPFNKNKMFVNVGGTYTYGNFLYAKKSSVYELSRNTFPDPSFPADTLQNNAKGYIDMPYQYRVGASFELPFQLLISADYEYTDWKSFKSFGNPESMQVASTGRYYLGADYIPKFRSQRYFDLISYRAGVNFGPTYYAPNGTQINETNVTVGFGLPIGRDGGSTLSLAFTGGQRGMVSVRTIREKYLRVTVAWAFADRWFVKPRLD